MDRALTKRDAKSVKADFDLSAGLGEEERSQLIAHFKDQSDNARAQIVMTFHLQGMTKEKMAKLLEVEKTEIEARLANAVQKAKSQMHFVPEGQLIMTQIVAEGYLRAQSRILSIANDRLEKLLDADEVHDSMVLEYLNVLGRTNERMADMMGKMGFTLFSKNLVDKEKERSKDKKNLEDVIEEMAKNESMGDGVRLAIVRSVEQDPAGAESTPLDEEFEDAAE